MYARWLNEPSIDQALARFAPSPALIDPAERPTLSQALDALGGEPQAVAVLASDDPAELAALRVQMKPTALAKLAWKVFTAWELAGHDLEAAGPLRSIEHVGNAAVAKRLETRIEWWARDSEERTDAGRAVVEALKARLKREREAEKGVAIKAGTRVRTVRGPALALDFSPDGRTLVVGDDAGARFHYVGDGRLVSPVDNSGPVTAARFADGGGWVALGAPTGVLRAEVDGDKRVTLEQEGPIVALEWALEDEAIAALSATELVGWDARSCSWFSREPLPEPGVALGREPRGPHVFAGTAGGLAIAHLIGDAAELDDLELGEGLLAISSPRRSGPLAIAFADGRVVGMSLHNGKQLWIVAVEGSPRIARSADDKRLLISGPSAASPLLLIDAENGEEIGRIEGLENASEVRCLALSPNGKTAAVGFADGEVARRTVG